MGFRGFNRRDDWIVWIIVLIILAIIVFDD